jgi:hypothetical protein
LEDSFANSVSIGYDKYYLESSFVEDALGNVNSGELDYRTLQFHTTTDVNGNVSEAAFDALGFVVGKKIK